MAIRRMFSSRIVKSARFLKMPASTRDLYFYLGMDADDDGVVEGYNIMNQIGATEDDLKILVAKGFVTVLNDDLVTYINDWKENNRIRSDRKVDSIYKALLLKVLPGIELQQARVRADTGKFTKHDDINDSEPLALEENSVTGRPLDVHWTTTGQPLDAIGKDRLGKDRLGKDINSRVDKSTQPNSSDIYKEIIDYLNKKTGKGYRSTTKSTQQKIKARLKEGFTVEDFKTVIDKKCSEWLNDPQMTNYLRPETLFSTKFESYLQQKSTGRIINGQFKRVEQGTDWKKKEAEIKAKRAREEANSNSKEFDPFAEKKATDGGLSTDQLKELFKGLTNGNSADKGL